MKKFVLLLSLLAAGVAKGEPENSCTSKPITVGCFEQSAIISVNLEDSTFTYEVSYVPICPVWPPFFQPIHGRVNVRPDLALELRDNDDSVLGHLSYRLWTGTYSGRVERFDFSHCQFE